MYSTESGRFRSDSAASHPVNPDDSVCRVRRETKGRGGKEATVIWDVPGGEAELKKRLDFIAKPLKNFTASFNYTLVKSISPIPEEELEKIRATDKYRSDTRPLTGQSPYLFNSTLEYNNDSLGMNVNLTFNQFGDRLVIYSSDGRPDVYEKSRPMLNLNFSKQINDRFKIKASLTNLLDPSFIQTYEYKNTTNSVYEKMENQEANFSSYKKGRSIGFGMSYKF